MARVANKNVWVALDRVAAFLAHRIRQNTRTSIATSSTAMRIFAKLFCL